MCGERESERTSESERERRNATTLVSLGRKRKRGREEREESAFLFTFATHIGLESIRARSSPSPLRSPLVPTCTGVHQTHGETTPSAESGRVPANPRTEGERAKPAAVWLRPLSLKEDRRHERLPEKAVQREEKKTNHTKNKRARVL